MSIYLTGALITSACILAGYLAFRFYRSGKFVSSLGMILVLGLVLRMYVGADLYLHQWDEKYHALVAKNMVEHPLKPTLYEHPVLPYDAANWTANHVWLEKGPVPLWGMAASVALFGTHEYAVRLPSMIVTMLSIVLTFLLASALFDHRTGLLAAFLHAVNGLVIELAGSRISSDHVETMFIFFVELAFLLVVITIIKKKGPLYALLIGLSTGLAVLSKWSPALLVFPVWLLAEIMAKKRTWKSMLLNLSVALLACSVVIAPWIIYILKAFPEEARWVLQKFIFAYQKPVEEHTGPFWFYFQTLGMVFGEIAWIPLLMALYFIIKKKAGWEVVLLSSWWIIPFILFSFAATKRHTYVLLFAPAIFILVSHYWFFLLEKIKEPKKQWWTILVLALLILLPVRYSFERTKLFQEVERSPEWSEEMKSMEGRYGPPEKVIIFNERHNIEGMFYTGYTIYDHLPPREVLDSLEETGYRIIIR